MIHVIHGAFRYIFPFAQLPYYDGPGLAEGQLPIEGAGTIAAIVAAVLLLVAACALAAALPPVRRRFQSVRMRVRCPADGRWADIVVRRPRHGRATPKLESCSRLAPGQTCDGRCLVAG